MARYAPPRTRLPRGTNAGDGPGLGAGATCSAFRLLSRYGLHVLAAEVAGINSSGDQELGARSCDVFMRRFVAGRGFLCMYVCHAMMCVTCCEIDSRTLVNCIGRQEAACAR